MKKILIPVFNHRISSRLDCTECFQLLEIDKKSICNSEKIKIISKNQMERLKSILEMKPDTVICNGLTEYCENEFRKNNIEVIPWVHGKYEDVVEDFLNGTLSSKNSA